MSGIGFGQCRDRGDLQTTFWSNRREVKEAEGFCLPLPEEEASGHWAARLPQHGVGVRLDSFVLGNKLRVYGNSMNTPKISELVFFPTYWT